MKNQLIIACIMLATIVCYTSALKCYQCTGKEADNACGKMGEEFDDSEVELVECTVPKPKNGSKTRSGRLVCGKTITTYQAVSDPENNGVIASRFCDYTEEDDFCTTDYGGTTETNTCVCSNEDGCNTATATAVTSIFTLLAAVCAAVM